MEMSTIGGFSFCGKEITNKKLDILLLDVERDALPNLSNPQGKRTISVTLGVYGKTAIERKQKIRLLLQEWIKQKGSLIFNDDAGLFFEAKLMENVPVTDLNSHMDGITLIFEASRELFSLEEKVLEGTTITTKNEGNIEADVLFKCTTNCTVSCNGTSFTIKNVTSPVYIDSKRMVVYTLVDGKEVNKAMDYTCDSPEYFIHLPKDIQVTITSTASIEVRYRDTYIV